MSPQFDSQLNEEKVIYDRAVQIATEAHRGQCRLDGSIYINHPLRVADTLKGYFKKTVAVLHDVLEDTKVTAEDLRQRGIPYEIIKRVEELTRHRKDGESYKDYILRIKSGSDEAIEVKLADLRHNLSDLDPEAHGSRKDKYELAYHILYNEWLDRDNWPPLWGSK